MENTALERKEQYVIMLHYNCLSWVHHVRLWSIRIHRKLDVKVASMEQVCELVFCMVQFKIGRPRLFRLLPLGLPTFVILEIWNGHFIDFPCIFNTFFIFFISTSTFPWKLSSEINVRPTVKHLNVIVFGPAGVLTRWVRAAVQCLFWPAQLSSQWHNSGNP